jgi:hypothetical protein
MREEGYLKGFVNGIQTLIPPTPFEGGEVVGVNSNNNYNLLFTSLFLLTYSYFSSTPVSSSSPSTPADLQRPQKLAYCFSY